MAFNVSPLLTLLCIIFFILVLVYMSKNKINQENYFNLLNKKLVYDPTNFTEISPYKKKNLTQEETNLVYQTILIKLTK